MNEDAKSCYCFGSPCETVTAITALALSIAKGKSEQDIGLLAAYFTQLGDTLEKIAVTMSTCCDE